MIPLLPGSFHKCKHLSDFRIAEVFVFAGVTIPRPVVRRACCFGDRQVAAGCRSNTGTPLLPGSPGAGLGFCSASGTGQVAVVEACLFRTIMNTDSEDREHPSVAKRCIMDPGMRRSENPHSPMPGVNLFGLAQMLVDHRLNSSAQHPITIDRKREQSHSIETQRRYAPMSVHDAPE